MTSLDSKLTTANRRFSFKGGGLPEGSFTVVEMTGFEALSKPFNFELILVSNIVDVRFDEMLSRSATLTIYALGDETKETKETKETLYHGVLSEFEQLQKVDTLVFYKAVLVPRLQRLSLYRTSDVFLNDKTIPDVLDTVIKASGLTSGDYEKKTTGSYRARTFVCQYQETNFDFISRWMEKEGMYYYFDHSDGKDTFVIVDDLSMQPAVVLTVTHRPVENIASSNASDSVHSFICRQQPLPKQVILQDFNYAYAKVPLEQSYAVSADGTGDVMLYGENFPTPEEGLRYAKLRAEQILCNGKVFKGEATATGIRSGHFIQLLDHYRADFIGNYLVTEIEHSGSQAGILLAGITHSFGGKSGETSYRHSFRAIPAGVQFRPECKTKRPYVAGTISAIIDAEGSGQYADLDKLGQYKVQLPFSKSGKAANQGSARIRMATPYAGSSKDGSKHGMHFPLLKGAEVLLSFMDGDPDQPVILGAVPNSENLNVVYNTNQYQNRIDTAGGNSIVLADTTGKETISIYTPGYNTWLTMGAATSKVAMALFPAVSYRVSTAGSINMFAGGSNVGASRGRSYVNLQGDRSFTLLGTSKMAWQGVFDLSFRSDISYRQDRISIDRLDNYARANNIIRHAEDTVTISAGRKDEQVEKLKKLTDRASLISKMKLALTAAIAVKDVIMVAISKEKEDVTTQPGTTKMALSPVFLALNTAYSAYMQDLIGDIKKQKKDTFHSNLVVGPGGLNMSAGTASVSITREEKSSPELPDTPSFFSLAGVANAVKNYATGKPDPKPMGRVATELQIENKIEGSNNAVTFVKIIPDSISMKIIPGDTEETKKDIFGKSKPKNETTFMLARYDSYINVPTGHLSFNLGKQNSADELRTTNLKLYQDTIELLIMNAYTPIEGEKIRYKAQLLLDRRAAIISCQDELGSAIVVTKEEINLKCGDSAKYYPVNGSEYYIRDYSEVPTSIKVAKESIKLSSGKVFLEVNKIGASINAADGTTIKFG